MKKEKGLPEIKITSKRLRNLKILMSVFILWLTAIIFLFIINLIFNILMHLNISLSVLVVIGFIVFKKLSKAIDKEFLSLTKGSYIYYKSDIPIFYSLILEIEFIMIFAAIITFFINKSEVGVLMNVNISLVGIVFAIYAFIAPSINKMLEKETQKYKKVKNENIKFKKQGEIYKTKLFVNKVLFNMGIMISIFLVSVVCVIKFAPEIIIIYSIIYESINLFQLMHLIKLIYHYNIKDLEEEMYKECVDANIIIKDIKKD